MRGMDMSSFTLVTGPALADRERARIQGGTGCEARMCPKQEHKIISVIGAPDGRQLDAVLKGVEFAVISTCPAGNTDAAGNTDCAVCLRAAEVFM